MCFGGPAWEGTALVAMKPSAFPLTRLRRFLHNHDLLVREYLLGFTSKVIILFLRVQGWLGWLGCAAAK